VVADQSAARRKANWAVCFFYFFSGETPRKHAGYVAGGSRRLTYLWICIVHKGFSR
jgi:hypothetical protein